MSIRTVPLSSICRPKQWKTISSKKLLDQGYPVYGANGIIGYYSEYNHEEPTILITCRGATCGKINISVPKSYINGNAMALDNLDSAVDLSFLKYYLEKRGFEDVISGSAQPQITRQNLEKVNIPLPPLEEQKRIAEILDKADEFRQKTKALIEKYDELAQSIFLDMFGDPVTNPKGWDTLKLKEIADTLNGYAFKSSSFKEVGVPLIRMSNFNNGPVDLAKTVKLDNTFLDSKKAFIVEKGDFLIALSGATTGKFGVYTDQRNALLNQRIGLVRSKPLVNSVYLHTFLKMKSDEILRMAAGAAQPNVSLKDIQEILVPFPPKELQKQFQSLLTNLDEQKTSTYRSFHKSEKLFNGLLQKAFKGELTN